MTGQSQNWTVPNFRAMSVKVVTLAFCRQHQIDAVIFDLDGTLRKYVLRSLTVGARNTLTSLSQQDIPWCVVSKSLPVLVRGAFLRKERDERLIACGFGGRVKSKEMAFGVAMDYFAAQYRIASAARVLCVGDYFSDIVAAHNVRERYPNLVTMLVDPVPGSAFWMKRRHRRDREQFLAMKNCGALFPDYLE